MTKEKAKKISFHAISVALIVASVLLAIFRFDVVFTRVVQSLGDLWRSVGFYGSLYTDHIIVMPTVQTIPEGMEPMLPIEWGEFKAKLAQVWALIQTKENLQLYFGRLGLLASKLAEGAMMWLPPIILVCLIVYMVYSSPNDKRGDTKALQRFKRFEKAVIEPIKDYISECWAFLIKSVYAKLLAWIWAYNLNVITIVIEFFAFFFYLSASSIIVDAWIDLEGFYVQFVKLLIDLTVAIGFIPLIVWLAAFYVVLDKVRRKMGVKILQGLRAINRAFLKLYKGALFLVGKQRSNKTTIITVMALEQETIYRDDARELVKECSKEFPFFPWLEIVDLRYRSWQEGTLPTLAMWRYFLDLLDWNFTTDQEKPYNEDLRRRQMKFFRKAFSYVGDDFIFGYDFERYGFTYDNGISRLDLFDVVKNHAQLFTIYAQPSSLIMGNYSIRTDLAYNSEGNFPDIHDTFFQLTPEESEEISQFCHIVDYDSHRLGVLMDENGEYKDAVEYGIKNMMEQGKERGNQHTNAGQKADADECNVRNDLYELSSKIKTHDATIMYYTFYRDFLDEQRPDSLSADNKDLCEVVQIVDVDDGRIILPLCAIEQGIFAWISSLYDRLDDFFIIKRGDNTLFWYLCKKIFQPIHQFFDKIKNLYTVKEAELKVYDGKGELKSEGIKFYLMSSQIFSDRFATDGLKDFWHKKALRSKYGLNDTPTFGGLRMTTDEMDKMHSIFYKKITKIFNRGNE